MPKTTTPEQKARNAERMRAKRAALKLLQQSAAGSIAASSSAPHDPLEGTAIAATATVVTGPDVKTTPAPVASKVTTPDDGLIKVSSKDARLIVGPQPPTTFTKGHRAVMNIGVAADGTAYYAVKGDWLKADTSKLTGTRWDRHEVILPLPTEAA